MKKFKKSAVIGISILIIGITSVTALAVSDYRSPAEIVAGFTGRSAESIIAEKSESGETYGSIAGASGVLDEFKSEMLAQKKAYLSEKVADGTMTQERADAILAELEANQANCDGTGNGRNGIGMGAGFGGMGGRGCQGGRVGAGCGLGASTGRAA